MPSPGFHSRPLDATATLHAASHAYVVVFYRPGAASAALEALATAATEQKVPLVVAPRAQRQALVAITQERRLDCAAAGAEQVDAIRRFSAASYPSL